MSTVFEQFLEERLPQPGIVACAIRRPDRSAVYRQDGEAMTSAQVEQTLIRVAAAAEMLKRHRLAAEQYCWNFDQARIHLALRTDGALLLVISQAAAGQPIDYRITRLIQAFRELQTD